MSREIATAPAKRTVRSALGVYAERPALVMVALGFSAGLPYFLIFDTLSAWLRASGLSLEVIGIFSLVTLVSTFKFLWAPFVDRARVPVLTGWLGHRRSWMLVCQGLIILGLFIGGATGTFSKNWANLFTPQHATPVAPDIFSSLSALTISDGVLGFIVVICVAQVGSLFSSDAWNNITFTAGEVKNPKRNIGLVFSWEPLL